MAHINNDSVAAGLFSPCLKVLSLFAFAGLSPSMIGLYDDQGMLRFSGRDTLACLDYAELFGLTPTAIACRRYPLTNTRSHNPASTECGLLNRRLQAG